MLARSERIARDQFENVYKKGRRIRGDAFLLVYTPSTSFACSVVVGKKVANLAHERATLRRRAYEVVRAHTPKLPPVQLVVHVLPRASSLSRSDFRAALHTSLEGLATQGAA